ncbi:unnamed protein product, partial [Mesorhabditis spiculigera]
MQPTESHSLYTTHHKRRPFLKARNGIVPQQPDPMKYAQGELNINENPYLLNQAIGQFLNNPQWVSSQYDESSSSSRSPDGQEPLPETFLYRQVARDLGTRTPIKLEPRSVESSSEKEKARRRLDEALATPSYARKRTIAEALQQGISIRAKSPEEPEKRHLPEIQLSPTTICHMECNYTLRSNDHFLVDPRVEAEITKDAMEMMHLLSPENRGVTASALYEYDATPGCQDQVYSDTYPVENYYTYGVPETEYQPEALVMNVHTGDISEPMIATPSPVISTRPMQVDQGMGHNEADFYAQPFIQQAIASDHQYYQGFVVPEQKAIHVTQRRPAKTQPQNASTSGPSKPRAKPRPAKRAPAEDPFKAYPSQKAAEPPTSVKLREQAEDFPESSYQSSIQRVISQGQLDYEGFQENQAPEAAKARLKAELQPRLYPVRRQPPNQVVERPKYRVLKRKQTLAPAENLGDDYQIPPRDVPSATSRPVARIRPTSVRKTEPTQVAADQEEVIFRGIEHAEEPPLKKPKETHAGGTPDPENLPVGAVLKRLYHENPSLLEKATEDRIAAALDQAEGTPSLQGLREELWDGEGGDSPKGSRAESSLLVLTNKFLELLCNNEKVNLNDACDYLGVPKRRLYDITNVLDGVDMITKAGKNEISLTNPAMMRELMKGEEEVRDSMEKKKQMEQYRQELINEANYLDDVVRSLTSTLKLTKENPVSKNYCYFTNQEIASFLPPGEVMFVVNGGKGDRLTHQLARYPPNTYYVTSEGGSALTLKEMYAPSTSTEPVFPAEEQPEIKPNVDHPDDVFAVPQYPARPNRNSQSLDGEVDNTINPMFSDLGYKNHYTVKSTMDAIPSTSAMGVDEPSTSTAGLDEVVMPPPSDIRTPFASLPVITPSKLFSPDGYSSYLNSPLKTLLDNGMPNPHMTPGSISLDDLEIPHLTPGSQLTLDALYEENVWTFLDKPIGDGE